MAVDRSLLNVFLLSIASMLVLASFDPMGSVQKTIIDSVRNEDKEFNGSSKSTYVIICTVTSILIWGAPSLVSVIGPRIAILIGGVIITFFTLSFLIPKLPLLYIVCVMLGFGEAILWPGLGSYLALNCSAATVSRNSGIFWAIYQMSVVIEHITIFFAFKGNKTTIDESTRNLVTGALSGLAIAGVIVMGFLPSPQKPEDAQEEPEEIKQSPIDTFLALVRLFFTQNMLLLCVTFFYTGIAYGFCSDVHIDSIAFTKNLNKSESLGALSGILVAVGEVFGGALIGILGAKAVKWGRNPIVVIGFTLQIVSFILVLLNLPGSSTFGETTDNAIIKSSSELAILSSLLLGLSDACYNTQIISMVIGEFAEINGGSFAIFKFVQTVAQIISFEYAMKINLYAQLGILVFMAIVGTFTFAWVEWQVRKAAKAKARTSGTNK